jgi:hypothetical protein
MKVTIILLIVFISLAGVTCLVMFMNAPEDKDQSDHSKDAVVEETPITSQTITPTERKKITLEKIQTEMPAVEKSKKGMLNTVTDGANLQRTSVPLLKATEKGAMNTMTPTIKRQNNIRRINDGKNPDIKSNKPDIVSKDDNNK